jgi:hypothetical protein
METANSLLTRCPHLHLLMAVINQVHRLHTVKASIKARLPENRNILSRAKPLIIEEKIFSP